MKLFPVIIVYLLIFSGLAKGQGQDSIKYVSLLPKDFQVEYKNNEKALLIDVREFFEFRRTRLQNAVNIPSSGDMSVSTDTINKECQLFLYCTSGFRSKRVAQVFYDYGFRNLRSLEGGIVAWKKEGLPVDKKRLRKHS
jgi:rhodanese-related sulfurtransferase